MQVKKSVCRKTETQKSFLQQETHVKKVFACKYFPNQDTRVMGGHVLASNTFVYKAITPLKNSQHLMTLYCIVTILYCNQHSIAHFG